jgi:integrase
MDFDDALGLIAGCDESLGLREMQNKATLLILLGCGLRINEAINIRPRDLTRERKTRIVRALIPHTKNKRELIVELPPQCVPLLDRIDAMQRKAGKPVSYFMDNPETSPRIAYERFRRDFKAKLVSAGLDSTIRIHSLRATFVTLLLSRGVRREKVQDLINQSSPASILPYDAFTGTDRDGIARNHHPLFQPEKPEDDSPSGPPPLA